MSEFRNPACTVDLIVPYDNGIILIKRKHEPYRGCWAIPGGFLDYGRENLEEAAVRELEEETSLVARVEDLELLGVYSDPHRDPRGHIVSHAYVVKNVRGVLKAADDAAEAKVFIELPDNLAFDHDKILRDYRRWIDGR